MKLPAFEHHRPNSIEEAVSMLGDLEDAKIIAGGQSLIPILALRMAYPEHLVDISSISELNGISDDGIYVRVGAAVTHTELERWSELTAALPLLAAAMPQIGHRAIRNRGTVCGSLAHADPAAELPAVAIVTGAKFDIVGPAGPRTVDAADFFDGYLTTVIAEDELLTAVRFPIADAGQGAAVEEASRRHGDFAMVGVAATVTLDHSGQTSNVSIGAFGVADRPIRLSEVEQAATGIEPDEPGCFVAAAEIARYSVSPTADDYGSTVYKQQLLATMTRRALQVASSRAVRAS